MSMYYYYFGMKEKEKKEDLETILGQIQQLSHKENLARAAL